MNSNQDEVTICVKCWDGFWKGDTLCHVGAYFCDGENVKHPMDTIIQHAIKLNYELLVTTPQK